MSSIGFRWSLRQKKKFFVVFFPILLRFLYDIGSGRYNHHKLVLRSTPNRCNLTNALKIYAVKLIQHFSNGRSGCSAHSSATNVNKTVRSKRDAMGFFFVVRLVSVSFLVLLQRLDSLLQLNSGVRALQCKLKEWKKRSRK